MAYALMSGGGKNSTLALDRARRQDIQVDYLVSIHAGGGTLSRFHGTPNTLLSLQANRIGLEQIEVHTATMSLDAALEQALQKLSDLEVKGVIFGDIALDSVREWYEDRVTAAGMEHLVPNWGEPSIEIAWEVVERGYQAIVVSVNRAHRAVPFLGREFDADLVAELGCTDGIDPSGERGEYHTFVFDGPAFSEPVDFSVGKEFELDGHLLIEMAPRATA